MRRTTLMIAAAAMALVLAACGSDSDDGSQPAITGGGNGSATTTTEGGGGSDGGSRSVTIVGENISFDTEDLSVDTGTEVTFTFENADNGIQHNLHITGPGGVEAKTEITSGPDSQEVTVTFDTPGEYTFVCDVHSNMRGTITVG